MGAETEETENEDRSGRGVSARAWFWLACILSLALALMALTGIADKLKFGIALYVAWMIAVWIGCAAALSLRKDDR